MFSDPLWEVSCLAGNFFGPRIWTFWTNPDISQTLTGKQKGAWESWLSFCFSVKAWDTAEKVQKVHLPTERDPKKISRQTGNFSKMIRKPKWCKIQRQIDPCWFCNGLVPLALTKSKKSFENILKILEIKNSFTKMNLFLENYNFWIFYY